MKMTNADVQKLARLVESSDANQNREDGESDVKYVWRVYWEASDYWRSEYLHTVPEGEYGQGTVYEYSNYRWFYNLSNRYDDAHVYTGMKRVLGIT